MLGIFENKVLSPLEKLKPASKVKYVDSEGGLKTNLNIDQDDKSETHHNLRSKLKFLHGGRQEGVRSVEITNGLVTARIIPTLGGSIESFKSDTINYGWVFHDRPDKEAVGPAHLDFEARGGIEAFLQNFGYFAGNLAGGGHAGPADNVISLDNTGKPSKTLYPLHGKLGGTPASDVEVKFIGGKEAAVVLECKFKEGFHQFGNWLTHTIRYTLKNGETKLGVEHEVKNESKDPQDLMAMYHLNQKVAVNDKVIAPIETIRARDKSSNVNAWKDGLYKVLQYITGSDHAEEVSYAKLKADEKGLMTSAVVSADDKQAVSFTYDQSLPDTTLWVSDKLDAVAIEPGSHHSVPRSNLIDRLKRLFGIRLINKIDPGEAKTFRFSVGIHEGVDNVNPLVQGIQALKSTPNVMKSALLETRAVKSVAAAA